MKELLIVAKDPRAAGIVDSKVFPSGWQGRIVNYTEIRERSALPDLLVWDIADKEPREGLFVLMKFLAKKQGGATHPSLIIIRFPAAQVPDTATLTKLLRPFPRPEQVEIRWRTSKMKVSDLVRVIDPKLTLMREQNEAQTLQKPPRPSPFDKSKKVLAVTGNLRVDNGNLSAARIAKLFGITESQIASWLGKTRQALNQAPAADAIQPELQFLERIARLRLLVSESDFRKWLKMPNELLEGKQPFELLALNQWQELADFVDDTLSGSPT